MTRPARIRVEILGDPKGAQRAISETEGALGRLGLAGRAASGGLRVVGDGFRGVARAAAVGAVAGTVALGTVATSVIQTGIQYESQLKTMGAVSHATAAEMQQVAAVSRDLGNDLTLPATSAADAAEAMTELAKGNLTAAEAMDAAKGTLTLAAAAHTDAAQAATIQADALNAFSLQANQAGHVADVLANAANVATGEITDFAFGLQASATVAKQLGVGLDDTVTGLALFANAGIHGSDAGTSLKTMLLALAHPSGQAADALKTLGVHAFDARGRFVGLETISGQLATAQKRLSVQAFAAAVATGFGNDAARAAGVFAQAGAAGFDKMAASVGRAGGAAQVARAQMAGVGGALQGLQSQIETVKIDAFTREAPALEHLIRALSDRLPDAAAAGLHGLDQLTRFVQREMPAARDAAAEFGPVVQASVSARLDQVGQVATGVAAPALRGVGTVLREVSGEAMAAGHVVDQVLTAGISAAGRVASGFEASAGGMGRAVAGFVEPVEDAAHVVLPVFKLALTGAAEGAAALTTGLAGAAQILGPFAGEVLLAVGAVKAAQLATAGWGKATGAVDAATSAYGRFADAAAIRVGTATEMVSKRLGSDLPTAAARGEAAMTSARSTLTLLGSALPVVGVGLLGIGYALERQRQQAEQARDRLTGYFDALRTGGTAADDASRNLQQVQDRMAQLQSQLDAAQGRLITAAQAGQLNQVRGQLTQLQQAYGAAKQASDAQYNSLSVLEQQQLAVTQATNDYARDLRELGPTASKTVADALRLGSAQQALKLTQDGVNAATAAGTKTLADYTDQVFLAANGVVGLKLQEIAVKQTQDSVATSQQALNTAVKTYGPHSAQARQASLALQQSQASLEQQILGAAQAAKQAAIAQDRTGDAAHAAAAGARAEAAELRKLAAGVAAGSPLRNSLAGIIAQLDRLARPRTVRIGIAVYGPSGITVGTGGLKIEARAGGGPVKAGVPYLVGEHGPEPFIPAQDGYILPTGSHGTATGGRPGTGNTYNINVTVAPGGHPADVGRKIVELIRQYEQGSGSGWRS